MRGGEDGPLLFAMLLGNQNNNNGPNGAPAPTNKDVNKGANNNQFGDTLQVLPSSTALEYNPHYERKPMRGGEDGPLFFALLLGNQNNNNGNNGANNNQNPNNNQYGDTLQVASSSKVLEYESHQETFSVSGQKCETEQPRGYLRIVGYAGQKGQADGNYNAADSHCKEDFRPVLSIEQLQFWMQNGYLVIEEALQPNQLSHLRASLINIVERLSDDKNSARKEHHVTSDNHSDDGGHIINPNGRIIAALLDDPNYEKLDPLQRIRRMGTGIHRIIPAFRSMTFSRVNQKIASLLGFEDPRVTQSIVVTKPRGVGAEVIPHQDGCSSFTDPPSAVTFWYALQDASIENGCLKVVPGSHRTEPLTVRTRIGRNGYPELFDLPEPVYAKDKELDSSIDVNSKLPRQLGSDGEYVYKSLEVKAGALILMHGNLVHASDANRSNKNRLAYNFGVVEGKLPWPKDAYLQPYEGHSEFEKLEPKS